MLEITIVKKYLEISVTENGNACVSKWDPKPNKSVLIQSTNMQKILWQNKDQKLISKLFEE